MWPKTIKIKTNQLKKPSVCKKKNLKLSLLISILSLLRKKKNVPFGGGGGALGGVAFLLEFICGKCLIGLFVPIPST